MNKKHYRNFAVYTDSQCECLVKVYQSFPSVDAFMLGDKAYKRYANSSEVRFSGIFGDNGKYATCRTSNIRRLRSDCEYNRLWKATTPLFKRMVSLIDAFAELQQESNPEKTLSQRRKECHTMDELIKSNYVYYHCTEDRRPTKSEARALVEKYLSELVK